MVRSSSGKRLEVSVLKTGDVEGSKLAYRVASSDTDVATVRVGGVVLTLTPPAHGTANGDG